jgi:hypothetical protein
MNKEKIIRTIESVIVKESRRESYSYDDYELGWVDHETVYYQYSFFFKGKMYTGESVGSKSTMVKAYNAIIDLCRKENVPHLLLEDIQQEMYPKIFG